jgi:hypothetical protein
MANDADDQDCTCPTHNRINALTTAAHVLANSNAHTRIRALARELLLAVAENDLLRSDIERVINALESRDAELAELRTALGGDLSEPFFEGDEDDDMSELDEDEDEEEVGAN